MKNQELDLSRPRTIKIEQIKHIYDYTKYHIGFYFALLTALGGFAKFGNVSAYERSLLTKITFVLLVAGIAGALVASRIVYGPWGTKYFLIDKSWFWKKRWNWPKRWKWWWSIGDLCLMVEHYGFWLALSIAIIGFAFVTPTPCIPK